MSADAPRPFEPAAIFWGVFTLAMAIMWTRPMHVLLSLAFLALMMIGLVATSVLTATRRQKTRFVWLALHEERYPLQAFDSEAEARAWIEQQEQDYAFSVERLIIRR